MNIYDKINYNTPQKLDISVNDYLIQIKSMIINTLEEDPTIVLHSDEEIKDKYNNSLIAIHQNKIIWNTNIYPTTMKPLDSIYNSKWFKIEIGELWSVIVDKKYRQHGVAKKMIKHSLDIYGSNYDSIVSATVHKSMNKIFNKYNFEQIPFPQEYFEEWKKYLWPKMQWGIKEFEEKATCVMLFNKNIRSYIFDILFD